MAEGIVYGLAQKILESLGKSALREVESWGSARADLQKLGVTMRMIKARLRDAENRNAEDNAADEALNEWLRRLRCVLYKADDLFDEVFTVDQQRHQNMEGGYLPKQVRILFSKSDAISFNRKVAKEIKSIRKDLDAIKSDMEILNLRTADTQLPMTRWIGKRETGSLVQSDDVIGRSNDKNNILEMLFLEPNSAEESIAVIPIVGFGGMGKTTLAQLVYNDERVQSHFDLTKWACVPDVDSKNEVIRKVFKSFTGRNDSGLSLEQLQSGIQESVNNKKYMLVLDDIWDESRDRWLDLMCLFRCGKRGSKIIVTTRSYVVAKVVGTIPEPYKLELLSDDDSWNLFKGLAFKPGQEACNPNLVPIGKEIVKRCGNVPLAIRAMGSTLYTKDTETEWMQFRGVQLSKKEQTGNIDIMPVLKLSYDHLPSDLKQCFAYCALFPKDYQFRKNKLVLLWMAQGFIKPLNGNDSLEDAGDQYFTELLMRNFFQDAIRGDENSLLSWEPEDVALKNVSCKMHDLVHDLALRVAGEESILVDKMGTTEQFHNEILHASVDYERLWEALPSLLNAKKIRSILNIYWRRRSLPNCEKVVSSFTRLRSLDLSSSDIERVPDCIGKLIHLRYLDLSNCFSIKCLPRSITALWNLQTLNLYYCRNLQVLPTGFSKLASLRHLDVARCVFLSDMPAGFRKLSSLQKLTRFVVGKGNGVDALAGMNLRGALEIKYCRWRDHTIAEATRANLKGKHRLFQLELDLCSDAPTPDDRLLLLEHLQPPPSLKVLKILGRTGERLPCWMEDVLPSLLPNLAEVEIEWTGWRSFPGFSQLPCLKRLILGSNLNLEYIESKGDISCTHQSCSSAAYFPSLEYLKLKDCPKLKGWWRSEEDDQNQQQQNLPLLPQLPKFPRLAELEMQGCPSLMSMPLAPRLRWLKVVGIQGKLLYQLLMSREKEAAAAAATASSLTSTTYLCEGLKVLEKLDIDGFPNLTALPESIGPFPQLRELEIEDCPKLRALSDSFHNLTILRVWNCPHFGDLLRCLPMLEELSIQHLPDLTALPESTGHLPKLRNLAICNCPKLSSLPDSFSNLTALQTLWIWGCPKLSGGCQQPHGKYWPLIQHLSHIHL